MVGRRLIPGTGPSHLASERCQEPVAEPIATADRTDAAESSQQVNPNGPRTSEVCGSYSVWRTGANTDYGPAQATSPRVSPSVEQSFTRLPIRDFLIRQPAKEVSDGEESTVWQFTLAPRFGVAS